MSGITNLYNFETQIEDGLSAVLIAAGLNAATPRTASKFQKIRPRVELLFDVGAARQSYHIVNEQKRNASWTGTLKVGIITESENIGSEDHRNYRAEIRNAMALAFYTMNVADTSAPLPYHEIQGPFIELSTSPSYAPQDGVEMSLLNYRVDFGIVFAAWAELST